MKKITNKLIIALLTVLLCVNAIFPQIIYAINEPNESEIKLMKDYIETYIHGHIEEYIRTYNTLVSPNNPISEPKDLSDEYLNMLREQIEEDKQNVVMLIRNNNQGLADNYFDYLIDSGDKLFEDLDYYINSYLSLTVVEPVSLDEFETKVRQLLETKLNDFQTPNEKIEYLSDFFDNWPNQLYNVTNIQELIDNHRYECESIIGQVISEYVQTLGWYTSANITIEQAIDSLKMRLAELRTQEESTYPDDIDIETRKIKLQNYFDNLKSEYQRGTGDFYNEVISVADRISNEADRQTFLGNILSYIDEFMRTSLGISYITSDSVWSAFSVVIDGVAGILLYPLKLMLIIIPGAVGQLVETNLAWIGSGGVGPQWVTFDDIFFNKLPVLDIDIFNLSSAAGSAISEGNVLFNIRKNVADWYYAIRNLCIVLSLAVLIYIGIRMAISSIADDKAKYKKMLKDWLVSFALIFVLHYFMVFVVQLNNGIVDTLNKARIAEEAKLELDLLIAKVPTPINLQSRILMEAFSPLLTRSFAAGVIYIMLVAMTFLFMIVYIKRMVTICFLAMIAPLITVTYAIDKAGDGKAQALGKWMSEFVFNILIQPFHCIIYMVFLQNIFYVINNTTGVLQIGKIVVAIVLLGFIYKAEDIVKDIFGFKSKNLSSAAVLGATAISRAQSFGKKAGAVKDAGAMATNIKGIKSPDGLPSTAQNNPSGPNTNQNNTNNQNQGQTGGNGTNTNKQSRLSKIYNGANHSKTAKKIAGNVLSASVAYGLTGDAAKAYGAHTVIKSGKDRIDNTRLKGSINERKDLTRDAYQDYAEKKGLNTKQARLDEAKRLINADIDTLTDPEERNMAEWLKAEQEMHEMLGSKDSIKDVLKNLRDYEDGV